MIVYDNPKEKNITTVKSGVITTGFESLDKIIGGWHKGELTIIGGFPAIGKTSFLLSSLMNVSAVHEIPAAFFSLSENTLETTNRLHYMSKCLAKEEWEVMQMFYYAPMIINCTYGLSVEDLRKQCLTLKELYNIQLIFVDYLQLLNVDEKRFDSRKAEITYILKELKVIAVELDIAIICSSLVTKGHLCSWSMKDGKSYRPKMDDFEGKDAIMEHADTIIAVHRPEYYHIYEDEDGNDMHGMAKLIVFKANNGNSGRTRLGFDDRGAYFIETKNH